MNDVNISSVKYYSPKTFYSSALSYLLNPFTILSCVAKSTCGLNNAVIALFILSTIKGKVRFELWEQRHCSKVIDFFQIYSSYGLMFSF